MSDAGFFRGTSSDQDTRFSDKEKKLMKQMKFQGNVEKKVSVCLRTTIFMINGAPDALNQKIYITHKGRSGNI